MARRNLKQIRGRERRRLGDIRPELIQERVDPMIKKRKASMALKKTKALNDKDNGNGKKKTIKANDIELSKSDKNRLRSKARRKTPLIPRGYSRKGKMGLF